MVTRKLTWTHAAGEQRRTFFRYWNNRNKSIAYSKNVREELSIIEKTIPERPDMFRETDYGGVRIVPRNNFSIHYRVLDSGDVLILAFWGRQNPNKLDQLLSE